MASLPHELYTPPIREEQARQLANIRAILAARGIRVHVIAHPLHATHYPDDSPFHPASEPVGDAGAEWYAAMRACDYSADDIDSFHYFTKSVTYVPDEKMRIIRKSEHLLHQQSRIMATRVVWEMRLHYTGEDGKYWDEIVPKHWNGAEFDQAFEKEQGWIPMILKTTNEAMSEEYRSDPILFRGRMIILTQAIRNFEAVADEADSGKPPDWLVDEEKNSGVTATGVAVRVEEIEDTEDEEGESAEEVDTKEAGADQENEKQPSLYESCADGITDQELGDREVLVNAPSTDAMKETAPAVPPFQYLRCICDKYNPTEEGTRVMICCSQCLGWQHNDCMDLPDHHNATGYHCERCRPDEHVVLLNKIKLGEDQRKRKAERKQKAAEEKRRMAAQKAKEEEEAQKKAEEAKRKMEQRRTKLGLREEEEEEKAAYARGLSVYCELLQQLKWTNDVAGEKWYLGEGKRMKRY